MERSKKKKQKTKKQSEMQETKKRIFTEDKSKKQ
jgi:hypothetical protein